MRNYLFKCKTFSREWHKLNVPVLGSNYEGILAVRHKMPNVKRMKSEESSSLSQTYCKTMLNKWVVIIAGIRILH